MGINREIYSVKAGFWEGDRLARGLRRPVYATHLCTTCAKDRPYKKREF